MDPYEKVGLVNVLRSGEVVPNIVKHAMRDPKSATTGACMPTMPSILTSTSFHELH